MYLFKTALTVVVAVLVEKKFIEIKPLVLDGGYILHFMNRDHKLK